MWGRSRAGQGLLGRPAWPAKWQRISVRAHGNDSHPSQNGHVHACRLPPSLTPSPAPCPLLKSQAPYQPGGRPSKLAVDSYLRVIGVKDVIALGDASLYVPERLPATAQASGVLHGAGEQGSGQGAKQVVVCPGQVPSGHLGKWELLASRSKQV